MRDKLSKIVRGGLWISVLIALLFCVKTHQELRKGMLPSHEPTGLLEETNGEKCVYTLLAPGSPEFAEMVEYLWYTAYMGAIDGVRKAVESGLEREKFIKYVNRLERVGTNSLFKNVLQWNEIKRLCKEGGKLFYYERRCESRTKAREDTGLLVVKDGKIVFREVLTEMEILLGE